MGLGLTVREIVLGYLAAFSTGDPQRVAGFVAEDFENVHRSALGTNSSGRSEYLSRLPGFLLQFSELSYEPEELVVEGGRAAASYLMRAKDRGMPVEIRGAMLFTVNDGLITRRVDFWDSLTYLRQIGQDATTVAATDT